MRTLVLPASLGLSRRLALPAAAYEAHDWGVEPGSAVDFTAVEAGAPVEGELETFGAGGRVDSPRFTVVGNGRFEGEGAFALRDVAREGALPSCLTIEDHPGKLDWPTLAPWSS